MACCRSCPPMPAPSGRPLLLDFPSAGHAPKRARSRRAVGKSAAWSIGPCVSREARQRSALLQRLRVRRFHHPSTADTVPDCGAMPADGKSRRRLWPQVAAGGHERQQTSHRSTTTLPPAASGISAARDPSLGRTTFLVRCPGPGKAVFLWAVWRAAPLEIPLPVMCTRSAACARDHGDQGDARTCLDKTLLRLSPCRPACVASPACRLRDRGRGGLRKPRSCSSPCPRGGRGGARWAVPGRAARGRR